MDPEYLEFLQCKRMKEAAAAAPPKSKDPAASSNLVPRRIAKHKKQSRKAPSPTPDDSPPEKTTPPKLPEVAPAMDTSLGRQMVATYFDDTPIQPRSRSTSDPSETPSQHAAARQSHKKSSAPHPKPSANRNNNAKKLPNHNDMQSTIGIDQGATANADKSIEDKAMASLYKDTANLYRMFWIDSQESTARVDFGAIRNKIVRECARRDIDLDQPLGTYDVDEIAKTIRQVQITVEKKLGCTWPLAGIRAVTHRKCLDTVKNKRRIARKKGQTPATKPRPRPPKTMSDSEDETDIAAAVHPGQNTTNQASKKIKIAPTVSKVSLAPKQKSKAKDGPGDKTKDDVPRKKSKAPEAPVSAPTPPPCRMPIYVQPAGKCLRVSGDISFEAMMELLQLTGPDFSPQKAKWSTIHSDEIWENILIDHLESGIMVKIQGPGNSEFEETEDEDDSGLQMSVPKDIPANNRKTPAPITQPPNSYLTQVDLDLPVAPSPDRSQTPESERESSLSEPENWKPIQKKRPVDSDQEEPLATRPTKGINKKKRSDSSLTQEIEDLRSAGMPDTDMPTVSPPASHVNNPLDMQTPKDLSGIPSSESTQTHPPGTSVLPRRGRPESSNKESTSDQPIDGQEVSNSMSEQRSSSANQSDNEEDNQHARQATESDNNPVAAVRGKSNPRGRPRTRRATQAPESQAIRSSQRNKKPSKKIRLNQEWDLQCTIANTIKRARRELKAKVAEFKLDI
ncbi:hypothetical protein EDC01DRAFT_635814 [Geopyxis carbonaria]|nr:hypothetical protein EDC01DRAFT_635814 [Geopyxis carbonaria]